MNALLRRIAFLLVFAVIMLPALLAALATLIVAGIAWIFGLDSDDIEQVLLNPVLGAIVDLPFRVLEAT